MCTAVVRSIEIGLLATLVATILGTLMAFALVRHRFEGRSAANLIIFMPMASPEIVMGSSLLALFVASGFGGQLGFWTILIAHIMFCLSFVVVTVRARLAGLDNNLEQAAMDLYATESQTFRRITFPLVFPGILGAALLSFSLSFDDFIITNLNAGNTTTFPMYVWGVAQRGVPMQVNVDRHADVRDLDRDRARRRAATGGGRRRRSLDGSPLASLLGASPTPYWLDDPDRPARTRRRGRARLRRSGRRGRRLPRAVDRAARQGARPRSRRRCCWRAARCGHAASGRNGGFCEASLTHGFGNGLARWPDELPSSRDGRGRTSTASSARSTSTASTATSCAPARSRWRPSSTRSSRAARGVRRDRAHGHGDHLARRRPACARGSTHRPSSAALHDPDGAAILEPARLAWGLREACLAPGVRIAERTPVTGWSRAGRRSPSETAAGRCGPGASCWPPTPSRRCCGGCG